MNILIRSHGRSWSVIREGGVNPVLPTLCPPFSFWCPPSVTLVDARYKVRTCCLFCYYVCEVFKALGISLHCIAVQNKEPRMNTIQTPSVPIAWAYWVLFDRAAFLVRQRYIISERHLKQDVKSCRLFGRRRSPTLINLCADFLVSTKKYLMQTRNQF